MQWRYNLERMELEKIKDPQLQKDLINASYMSQDRETDSARYAAWGNYRDAIGIDMSAEDDRSRREEAITEALEWELITREEYQQRMLESERQFHADRAILAFNSGENIAGSFSDMFKTIGGEQSAAYKTMFAIEKGFAIAQSIMAIQTGIANAMSLPFPANLAAAATVASETSNIVSNIQAITLSGMAHDGIDNIPKEGTWLLDKGERVVDSRTNADLKGMIANQKNGGGDVNITVHVTDSGVSTQSNQNEQKQLGQMIGNAVRTIIRQEQRQGGLLAR